MLNPRGNSVQEQRATIMDQVKEDSQRMNQNRTAQENFYNKGTTPDEEAKVAKFLYVADSNRNNKQ